MIDFLLGIYRKKWKKPGPRILSLLTLCGDLSSPECVLLHFVGKTE